MTNDQKKKFTKLLAKISLGIKAAKGFFDAVFDDNFSGSVEVSRPKMTKRLSDAENAVEKMKQYLKEKTNEEK
ncbi:MAG: hypothetical protein IJG38_02095 [Thermoguttaceae bacterium]|nr:hypothetical protein [Thermoguttaceae bacterium]